MVGGTDAPVLCIIIYQLLLLSLCVQARQPTRIYDIAVEGRHVGKYRDPPSLPGRLAAGSMMTVTAGSVADRASIQVRTQPRVAFRRFEGASSPRGI